MKPGYFGAVIKEQGIIIKYRSNKIARYYYNKIAKV